MNPAGQSMSTQPRPVIPRRLRIAVALAVLVLVLASAVVGFLRLRSHPQVTPAAPGIPAGAVRLTEAEQKDAGIVVEPARTISRTDHLEAPGTLHLDETQTARLGSMVEGKVLTVQAQVGDRVERGQVLAELHSQVIHEAWAAYRKAIAERKRAMAELTYASQALERAERLYADKAVSLQEVQRAKVDRETAAQSLDMAMTEVRRSEESLEHLGVTSGEDPSGEAGEQIPITSPVTGAVLERLVTAGTAVTPGMPLFVVSNLSTLWALAETDETKLPFLKVGMPVEVRVAAYPEEGFPGTIIFVSDTLDPTTRRVNVRCEVPNPNGRLKPQMYATIALTAGAPRSITAVPTQAIHEMEGRTVVFVANQGETFSAREVDTGNEAQGWVEIRSGLQAGEQVATAGSFLVKSELLKAAAPAED